NVSGSSGRSMYRNAADGWPGRALERSSDASAPDDGDWAGAAALAFTSVAVVLSADFPNMVCLLLRREPLIQQVKHDFMRAAMGCLLRFNYRTAKSTRRACAKLREIDYEYYSALMHAAFTATAQRLASLSMNAANSSGEFALAMEPSCWKR